MHVGNLPKSRHAVVGLTTGAPKFWGEKSNLYLMNKAGKEIHLAMQIKKTNIMKFAKK